MRRCFRAWLLLVGSVVCERQSVADTPQARHPVPKAPPMQELPGNVQDVKLHGYMVGSNETELSGEVIVTFVIFVEFVVFSILILQHRRAGQKAKSRAHHRSSDEKENAPVQSQPVNKAAAQSERAQLSNRLNHQATIGQLQEMSRTLEDIEELFPSNPDMTDYHRVIVHLARGGHPTVAHRWLRRSQEVGLLPKHGTFTTVIRSYVKAGAFARANCVADEMTAAGLEFDTVSYNAMIHACLCGGDARNAQLWMKKMLVAGVQPNAVSLATVMLACASVGLVDDLDWWFGVVQASGFQLKARTFDSIVGDFQRREDDINAMKWLTNMIKHGLRPETNTVHRVISVISNKDNVELADKLIEMMRAAGVTPSSCILNRCVVLAARNGKRYEAQQWADECVAGQGRLTEKARDALFEAGLRIPTTSKGGPRAQAATPPWATAKDEPTGRRHAADQTDHGDDWYAQWKKLKEAMHVADTAATLGSHTGTSSSVSHRRRARLPMEAVDA